MHDGRDQHDFGTEDSTSSATDGVTLIVSEDVGVRVVHRGDLDSEAVAAAGRRLARRALDHLSRTDELETVS